MNLYMISFDLDAPGQDYSKVEGAIKRLDPKALRVLTTTWLVATTVGYMEVGNAVCAAMDSSDDLFVGQLGVGGSWFGFSDREDAAIRDKIKNG